MSEQTIIALVLIGTAVGALVGYIIGRDHGIDYGRASQWVDDYIDRAREAKRRRDAYGRFTSTRRATT